MQSLQFLNDSNDFLFEFLENVVDRYQADDLFYSFTITALNVNTRIDIQSTFYVKAVATKTKLKVDQATRRSCCAYKKSYNVFLCFKACQTLFTK